jgi:hypothetical protein
MTAIFLLLLSGGPTPLRGPFPSVESWCAVLEREHAKDIDHNAVCDSEADFRGPARIARSRPPILEVRLLPTRDLDDYATIAIRTATGWFFGEKQYVGSGRAKASIETTVTALAVTTSGVPALRVVMVSDRLLDPRRLGWSGTPTDDRLVTETRCTVSSANVPVCFRP